MSKAEQNFVSWIENVKERDIREELELIKDKKDKIEERFGKDISFGTAGLRGIMECGTNRINIYTVRKATQGLCDYIRNNNLERVLAVSYDSRRNSKLFAKEVAMVGAANGLKVYITQELAPTPFLSYMVRSLGSSAGVMITASHNTAEYNGYKCYGGDGAQMNEVFASGVYEYIKKVDMFHDVKRVDFEYGLNNGLIYSVGDDLKERYIEEVLKYHRDDLEFGDLKAVYTPLNGTGNKYVRETLSRVGLENLYVVESQEKPDENFTTCPNPNPEKLSAFNEAMKVANTNKADIILATDPDADRLGVCVRVGEEYKLLSGNEIGILLANYILECRRNSGELPKNGVIIKTIVSTMMIDEIAKEYKCDVKNVLTGFKNIAYEIALLEKSGEEYKYLFGFEESNGYLCGIYVRDKDAVSASLLMCDAVAYYKKRYNKNLFEVLGGSYSKYGYFGEKTISYDLKNLDMAAMMERFRGNSLSKIGKFAVLEIKDYLKFEGNLKSNVLEFVLENEMKIVVRPSGTEPKLKVYIMVKGRNTAEKTAMINSIEKGVSDIIEAK